jgi:hypothetical protein
MKTKEEFFTEFERYAAAIDGDSWRQEAAEQMTKFGITWDDVEAIKAKRIVEVFPLKAITATPIAVFQCCECNQLYLETVPVGCGNCGARFTPF